MLVLPQGAERSGPGPAGRALARCLRPAMRACRWRRVAPSLRTPCKTESEDHGRRRIRIGAAEVEVDQPVPGPRVASTAARPTGATAGRPVAIMSSRHLGPLLLRDEGTSSLARRQRDSACSSAASTVSSRELRLVAFALVPSGRLRATAFAAKRSTGRCTRDHYSWAKARATSYSAGPRSGRPLFGEALAREGQCGGRDAGRWGSARASARMRKRGCGSRCTRISARTGRSRLSSVPR